MRSHVSNLPEKTDRLHNKLLPFMDIIPFKFRDMQISTPSLQGTGPWRMSFPCGTPQ